MVLHDWVERLTEKGIVEKILHDGPQVLPFQEGALHAGRVLGCGLPARPQHGAPDATATTGCSTGGRLPACSFDFSGLSGGIIGDLAPNPPTAPTPVPVLPSNWIIDWRRFYDLGASGGAAVAINTSRKLDPFLVKSLHTLPGGGGNLAFRNLKRGVNLGLPSGQDVAKHMKIKNPLTPDEIASDSGSPTARWPSSRACIQRRRFGTTS